MTNIVDFKKPEPAKPPVRPPSEPILNLPPFAKYMSIALILSFVAVQYLPFFSANAERVYALSFVSARYTDPAFAMDMFGVMAPVSYMFIHAGWIHLLMNVISLMAFSAGLEKMWPPYKVAMLFFATGFAGAMGHLILAPDSLQPLVGASGAISGLFAGTIIAMQRLGYLPPGPRGLVPLVLLWLGITVLFGFWGMPNVDGEIAWAVHVFGFFAGLAFFRTIDRLT